MSYVDAHCHLSDPRFAGQVDQVIERARAKGITRFVLGGVWPDEWDTQLELKERYPDSVYLCFGLHPWWVAGKGEAACAEALKELGRRSSQAVALGELGIDHGPRVEPASHGLQMELFKEQLKLACRLNQPIVLHIVRAHVEALKILREIGVPARGGMVHSYSSNLSDAKAYLGLGLKISVGGSVTRKGFERLKQAVVALPLEHLVLESDAPDQPTPSYQGQLNEPACLWEVAEAVATLKGDSLRAEAVLERSTETLRTLFGF